MNSVAGRSPSAARLAGDDFQHLVAWNEALEALRSPAVTAVTVEHPDAGNVDDVVVHRDVGQSLYTQVKHAVDASTPVGQQWLMSTRTSNPTSSSVLQKFHRSWHDLTTRHDHPELRLITDREIDPNDAVMRGLDRVTELLVPDIRHRRAAEGRALWSQHLDITEDELVEFLGSLRFETGSIDQVTTATSSNADVRGGPQQRPAGHRLSRGTHPGLGPAPTAHAHAPGAS